MGHKESNQTYKFQVDYIEECDGSVVECLYVFVGGGGGEGFATKLDNWTVLGHWKVSLWDKLEYFLGHAKIEMVLFLLCSTHKYIFEG